MKHWLASLWAWIGVAQAHEGHGMAEAVHWHAVDAIGFVVAGIAVAAVWWLGRNK